MVTIADDFGLTAIPFFVLAAEFMEPA